MKKSQLKKICKCRNREKEKMMFFRWKKNWPKKSEIKEIWKKENRGNRGKA